jgi:hypothetical protein
MEPIHELLNLGLAIAMTAWLSMRLSKSEEALRDRLEKVESEAREHLVRVVIEQSVITDRTCRVLERVEKLLDRKNPNDPPAPMDTSQRCILTTKTVRQNEPGSTIDTLSRG